MKGLEIICLQYWSVLECVAGSVGLCCRKCWSVLQEDARRASDCEIRRQQEIICTSQCVAVCCSMLQCVVGTRTKSVRQSETDGKRDYLCVVVCCSVLQRMAVYCSVFQEHAQRTSGSERLSREGIFCL